MSELSLSEIVSLASEKGAEVALERFRQEQNRYQKKKHDWRLRNTKLLLRHYREFAEHAEEIESFLSQDAQVLDEMYDEGMNVESIMRSKRRTLVMVKFIRRMLESYLVICEKSGSDEELRRYKIVHAMYIDSEKMTADEIAKLHFIARRTVFLDIDKACETLSVLIFGVDAIRLE